MVLNYIIFNFRFIEMDWVWPYKVDLTMWSIWLVTVETKSVITNKKNTKFVVYLFRKSYWLAIEQTDTFWYVSLKNVLNYIIFNFRFIEMDRVWPYKMEVFFYIAYFCKIYKLIVLVNIIVIVNLTAGYRIEMISAKFIQNL